MKVSEATLQDYAAELVKLAQVTEQRAETYYGGSYGSRLDKYHNLLGQANGLRYASEGLTELLTQPGPHLWSVKS